ncbi:MAG: PDZ domain-containing protein [Pirellulales bacterium]
MNRSFASRLAAGFVAAAVLALPCALLAADDIHLLEEQAMQAAVARVAPAVVKIETVGGLEKVGEMLVGTGPTTGVVVTPDGYILSSAFNFIQQPSSILVTLANGTRHSAKRVSTDHSRLLVLLKIESDKPLPAAEAVPDAEIAVGAWSIAVGRTYEGTEPNVSVGIVSAVKRIWGKAIQTDAKISPSNYGGPLVDIRGRVQGILTPMSPQSADEVAGVEWYDSGIGFAVPLADMLTVLPRLQQGDLHAGILGINLRGKDIFADPPIIAAARPNSPAYDAGLKADDKVVEFAGQAVVRQSQLKQLVGPLYAGDKVTLVALRGEERIERELELIAKLEPYVHPFLGLLPRRDGAGVGIPIRFVYPGSPADEAGVQPGDVLTAVGDQKIETYATLLEKLAPLAAGDTATFIFQRGADERNVELKLAALPEEVPAELPEARQSAPPADGERPATGRIALKLPESAAEAIAYVPTAYDPAVPQGIVLWLNAGGAYSDEEATAAVERWQAHCDRDGLILLAPRSLDGGKWDPAKDAPDIRKHLDQLAATYRIDPARVVAVGQTGGAAMAYYLAMNHRDLFRGVASLDAPPNGTIAENEPIYRLAFWTARSEAAPAVKVLDAGIKRLRDLKYPVTVLELGESPRDLSADEFAGLIRWVDTLDAF